MSPGPSGLAAGLIARASGTPIVGSYHTELAAYTGMRSGDDGLAARASAFLGAFYGQCRTVLSPSSAADQSLRDLGIEPERIARWSPGVDLSRFDADRRRRPADPETLHVLYAGRLTVEKGVDLLADAFLAARDRDPRLRLLLAGGGPRSRACESAWAVPPRSSAGSRATTWHRPTRMPTCSCSRRAPTRSAR